MSKKNILIGAFICIACFTALLQYKQTLPTKQIREVQTILITQIVSIDGKKTHAPIHIKKGLTALQLLSSNHKVIIKGEKENAYITSIDGRSASSESKEFWSFYINGKQSPVGAGSYFLKNNDTIEWKIETYSL